LRFDVLEGWKARAQALGIGGSVHPDFTAVADAFIANFDHREELGASLFITIDGQLVVDLWGGRADAEQMWGQDTVCVVFSCTKAATALCLHILAERGEVSLDAAVAHYWPEFAKGNKSSITLGMLLDHSAGLPALREKAKSDCLTDWAYMVDRLEREDPFWEPGARVGYHALTFGFLIGEIVRRVSGRSLGTFFRDEIARPLDIDFWIGLPEAEEHRVAPIEAFRAPRHVADTPFIAAARTAGSIPNLFVFNSGDWSYRGVNTTAGRAAEIGAAGGVTNARGLGRMFAALADGGSKIGLSPETIATFSRATSATHLDATFMAPSRFGPGFMLGMAQRPTASGPESLSFGEHAFGHVGMGGSVGFADPECRLGFAYVMNRQGGGLLLNERGQSLVDAVYGCLGHRKHAMGFWTRN
jgi:CubicO group peptidase (beta-lactamase class C family)